MVMIKSKQPDIIVSHNKNPAFEIEFVGDIAEVRQEVADYLITLPNYTLADSKAEIRPEPTDRDEYQEEIIKIKGIGPKTARDIIQIYPTREDLITAIRSGNSLPMDDGTEKLLKQKYEVEK